MKIIIFHCIQFMDSPPFGHVDVAAIGHQKTHSPVSAHKQSWLSHQQSQFADRFNQIHGFSCCPWELSDPHLRHRLKVKTHGNQRQSPH